MEDTTSTFSPNFSSLVTNFPIDQNNTSKRLGIFFSSGDIGDVGRHAVEVALEMPNHIISTIKVFSTNGIQSLFCETDWKCGCQWSHTFRNQCLNRLEIIDVDCSKEDLDQYFANIDVVISCLGNRKPFHPESIAKKGTERIIRAMLSAKVNRIVMLSSVGISNDWPPMEWSKEGDRLQGFFRTICWNQYQDLSGAELAIQLGALENVQFDFLIARTVLLSEISIPKHSWYVQNQKYQDHPVKYMAKLDCARFLLEEAIWPSLHRTAVVVGGMPSDDVDHQTSIVSLDLRSSECLRSS